MPFKTRAAKTAVLFRSSNVKTTALYTMLGRLESYTGASGADLCLDLTYLARVLYSILDAMRLMSYIKPKKNAVYTPRAASLDRVMLDPYLNSLLGFKGHCYRCSVIESTLGAHKTMYGSVSGGGRTTGGGGADARNLPQHRHGRTVIGG